MRLKEADPATISLVVTIVGTVLVPVPVLGAGLGLYLGYKALREARAGGWNSEKLARTAVIVGWIGLAYLVLPLCIWLGWLGCAGAASVCEGLWETLFNRLGGIL
jgi:hypothetical protein